MKIIRFLSVAFAFTAMVSLSNSVAAEAAGRLIPAKEKDAAWVAKAKAEYPTANCVVSGDALGAMDSSVDFVYRAEGKPDRLVSFCCKDCPKDFLEDPQKYLKELDEAAAQKKSG